MIPWLAQRRRLIAEFALVSGGLAVLASVAWWLLAPDVVAIVFENTVQLDETGGRAIFGYDAWFGIVTFSAGLLAASICGRHLAAEPIATPVGLALFGLLGSLFVRQLGGVLGPDLPPAGTPDLTEVIAPLELMSTSMLLLWPMACVGALLLTLLLTAQVPDDSVGYSHTHSDGNTGSSDSSSSDSSSGSAYSG